MAFGFLAVGKIKMSPQELVIGSRSFGTILLSLLFAGETITSFTFLGAAGWGIHKRGTRLLHTCVPSPGVNRLISLRAIALAPRTGVQFSNEC